MNNKRNYRTLKSKVQMLPMTGKMAIILLLVVIVRMGSSYPLPFVNQEYMRMVLGMEGLGFLNSITGGSMQQMSFFALSISPYITASIIMQLFTVVIPSMEELQKDGKTGQEKFKKITKITAITLSVVQSAAMAVGLGAQGLLVEYKAETVLTAIIIWSIGSIILIGMSEFINWMEVGNGVSILLCSNILAMFPSDVFRLRDTFLYDRILQYQVINAALITFILLAIIAVCVVLGNTSKEIPVIESRKMIGNAGKSTFPIPLNTCSVMPVIFASSIMSLPIIICSFMGTGNEGWLKHVLNCLTTTKWFDMENPVYTVGAVFFFALTTFFTYFYLDIGFNSFEIAENLKNNGMTIPGIRPGKPTAEYIKKQSTKIALTGNMITTTMILLMHLICNMTGVGELSVAGTSILILVGLVVEERKLITSVMVSKKSWTKRSGGKK